jgi:RNA polymerase sigma-70 factor (ECF subfamily)
MVQPDDDAEWIHKSQHGDADAFGELVKRYERMVHSLTFRMTGSMAEAQDLAQDAFVQAFRHLESFRGEAKFSSWLYRLTMNACLNWRKRRQIRVRVYERWEREQKIDSQPREKATADALSQKVQDSLLKLPCKQRAAVVLTVFDGFSHAEAAQVLGCSETTVSWRLYAARGKLKRWLKDFKPK